MKLTSLLSFLNAVFCPALLLTWLATPQDSIGHRRGRFTLSFPVR